MFPAEPASVAQARQHLVEALEDWGEAAAVEVVELLVSELVTNAVLHAGSPVELVVRRQPGRVRVEVGDDSSMAPHRRDSDEEATVGRGVDMVEMLAEQWGVDTDVADGKVVWFEVSASASVEPADALAAAPVDQPLGARPLDGAVPVHLLQAPVRLMATMQQHAEALLREVTLRSFDETESWVPVRLGVDFDELDQQLAAASRAGQTAADLVVHVPGGSAADVRQAAEALSHGDRLAAEGLLLCPPALPEVADCRRWFLDQLIDQLEGRPAEAWQPRATGAPAGALNVDHAEVLDQLAQAVVVADDGNRVTYVNTAGENLLGWPAEELVGQRLTTIIPERLHHAHVAGYTRYLTTGEPRLIGTPVRVPARCRNGSEVDVELTLSVFRTPAGRPMFAAVLHRGAEHAARELGDDRSARVQSLVERLRSVAEDTEAWSPDERRRRALAILAGELGWQFAAWWIVDGDVLRCVTTWQQSSEMGPFVAATTEQRFSPGRGLPGRVWSRQAPAWIVDLVADANFPRASIALSVGLRSGCGFPLVAEQQTMGVVELFATRAHPADEDLMASLAEIGTFIDDLG